MAAGEWSGLWPPKRIVSAIPFLAKSDLWRFTIKR
jgi:hypothetical protein